MDNLCIQKVPLHIRSIHLVHTTRHRTSGSTVHLHSPAFHRTQTLIELGLHPSNTLSRSQHLHMSQPTWRLNLIRADTQTVHRKEVWNDLKLSDKRLKVNQTGAVQINTQRCRALVTV